jgi:hypothetical protein
LAELREQPLFEKSGAKTFITLEPGVLNVPGADSKKSFWFLFGRRKRILT